MYLWVIIILLIHKSYSPQPPNSNFVVKGEKHNTSLQKQFVIVEGTQGKSHRIIIVLLDLTEEISKWGGLPFR